MGRVRPYLHAQWCNDRWQNCRRLFLGTKPSRRNSIRSPQGQSESKSECLALRIDQGRPGSTYQRGLWVLPAGAYVEASNFAASSRDGLWYEGRVGRQTSCVHLEKHEPSTPDSRNDGSFDNVTSRGVPLESARFESDGTARGIPHAFVRQGAGLFEYVLIAQDRGSGVLCSALLI